MRKKVISHGNMPPKLPFVQSAVVWLLLDRLQVTSVTWAVCETLVVVLWIACIAEMFMSDAVDVLNK